MRYGDYFCAARDFLVKDQCALVRGAVAQITGQHVPPAGLRQVSVYLVKYGAFYHPGYVVVEVGRRRHPFVLNVAVSAKGRRMIAREYQVLSQLDERLDAAYWPRVFGFGEGLDSDGRPIPMFLGQWLEGFHEFHLSGEPAEQRHTVVWDTQHGHRTLTRDQVGACLRQAACILTHAYNPLTFEAIRHWHHAAGDFVVALDNEGVTVRLITAREYAPIIAIADPDIAAVLDGLLVFLLEISLKLRLDRLEGIGRIVCHDVEMVAAICEGFFQGLASAAPVHGLPGDFVGAVREFIAMHDLEQLGSIASSVLKNISVEAGERDLLAHNLNRHLSLLRNNVTP